MRWLIGMVITALLVSCLPQSSEPQGDDGSSQKPQSQDVSVQGVLRYQDRFYNQFGFLDSTQTYKTVRRVPVSIVDSLGNEVSTTVTNEAGHFDLGDVTEGDYVIRFHAESTLMSGTRIRVQDTRENSYVIEVPVTVSVDITDYDIDLLVQQRVAGIFNMLDVFYSAVQFVEDLTDAAVSVNDLDVTWQWGDSAGSYTCRADNPSCTPGIYVLSDPYYSGDTDEFDDDVLLHEFAHHLESSLYFFDSPGGAHTLHSTSLDLRLSWSEGMASAFASSVKQWLRQNDPGRLSIPNYIGLDLADYYIDTRGSGTSVALDLRQASPSIYHYATNEVAVAASVLALQSSVGMDVLWPTLITSLSTNATADTVESFWDGLVGYNSPSTQLLASWQSMLATRDIHYAMDALESNQTKASARPIDDTLHSLYRNHYTTDVDWHVVDVTGGIDYMFETYALINGADTYLELFDANENLLLSNDDSFDCEAQAGGCSPLHDGTNFSSSITYTPATDETLYLRVSTAPAVYSDPTSYGYIGRYGGYKIRVTEQP